MNTAAKPLIAHIIHRLDVGGLENGLINLINNMSESKYRHVIICMTEYTNFRYRLNDNNIEIFQLLKCDGKDLAVFYRLWKLLRKLRPDIVHTRNLGTLECVVPALLAGVNIRIHGEHGRDMLDIDGTNKKYITLRKILKPFVSRYIALSKDLESWLHHSIGVKQAKIRQLYNGVDVNKFSPREVTKHKIPDKYFVGQDVKIIGTVGRISGEKDQFSLVLAMAEVFKRQPELTNVLRLIIIGDGPLFSELEQLVREKGLQDYIWLAGARDDIPELFNEMKLFILPSLGEGISNTILEAMASGLPVIATNVGGNPELVIEGKTGTLVQPKMPDELADKIIEFHQQPYLFSEYGRAAKKRIEKEFSLDAMVRRYISVYDDMINV